MLELSESNIHLNATATNKLQAIEMAASALEQAGNVEQGYLQGMLGREQQTSTFLGNGIAIPHGTLETRSMVKKTGVQVFQFPQGIEWGEGNIAYVVIGIAARSDEHLALLRQLTHVLGDEDTAAQLATLTDVEKFRAILLGESDAFTITEETLSLDIETQSLLTLTAINAGKLQQQSAVENTEEITQTPSVWKEIFIQGVWKNNSTLVQLLGLCPLLAVSSTATNALGLGLATMLVLTCTNTVVSLFRKQIPHDIRIPIYVMIIATTVTVVQLLMNAYTYTLYQALGIFIPLIVTNCIVIGRAEAFASKNSVAHAAWDGFSMGLGMALSITVLGALREILGQGTLFEGIENLFGQGAKFLTLHIYHADSSFLLFILPPGAFIGLGILLAIKNRIDMKK